MKTLFGAVAVIGIMATSGLAMAQSSPSGTATSPGTTAGSTASAQQATGTVSKLDRSSNTVTMQDGTKYKLSSSADLGKVKEGDQVRVQYQMQGSDRMATAIMPATGAAGTSGTGSSSGSGGSTPGAMGSQKKQ